MSAAHPHLRRWAEESDCQLVGVTAVAHSATTDLDAVNVEVWIRDRAHGTDAHPHLTVLADDNKVHIHCHDGTLEDSFENLVRSLDGDARIDVVPLPQVD